MPRLDPSRPCPSDGAPRVAGGSASPDPWQPGIPANSVAAVVRDLAAALLWPAWLGSMHDKDTIAVARDHAFAALAPRIAYEVLGIIASVLTDVAGGSPLRTPSGQIEGEASSGAAVDLAWFIRRLPAGEQRWLKVRAGGWGPVLARVVGDAVDVEEAARRRAIATREQARRESAWSRPATVKHANDARRRIAARAAKRKAAALKRKRNQTSAIANGPL
jgi:hypothetical protein